MTNSENTLIELRATLAMRVEDHRIATKHRIEAAERVGTPANRLAYARALRWEADRAEAERVARVAVIAKAAA